MVDPRAARPTLRFVDEDCEMYADLFPEVRSFEAFKYLHVGMISDLKRKTLPAIAKAVGLNNEQGLHPLLTKSPWSVTRLRQTRLKLILELVNGQSLMKNLLNTLRLIIEPWITFNRLRHWLRVFKIPSLEQGFAQLIEQMQQFYCPIIHDLLLRRLLFNSA